jgi:SAM-dependent methyltransferase
VTAGEPEPGLYETGAYRPGTPRMHTLARPLLAAFDWQRLSLLARLVAPGGRVLDVGAGRGRFVSAALAAGYDASGIEPSGRGGAAIERVGIEDAQLPGASLDAAVLWHVLEHLDEPAMALRRVRGWLRPGGGLLLGVPNLASVQAAIGGARWYHLDVPRHRVHFTPAGIEALVHRSGLSVVGVHHVLLEHNPFGLWQSLVNRLTAHPSYLYNLLKRNAPAASRDLPITLAAIPMAPLAALLELLAALAGRGGTIAVLARREG